MNSTDIREDTIWSILSAEDKKIILVTIPFTYPPFEVNGAMVSPWGKASKGDLSTFPQDLGKRLTEKFGEYKFLFWDLARSVSDISLRRYCR